MKLFWVLVLSTFSLFAVATSNSKIKNEFSFLQDITFELYSDNLPEYKAPEHMQSIEEILLYDIIHATFKDGKWVAYTLNKNLLGTYKIGSPTLIEQGVTKKMIFIANFPGNKGGTDLYLAEYKDGQWTKPRNMGNIINSAYNESNPGMLDENTLTYSSNGNYKKLNLTTYEISNSETTETTTTQSHAYETPKTTIVNTPTTYETPKKVEPFITTTFPTPKSANFSSEPIMLGASSVPQVLSKYPLAIQIGSFLNPNWKILQQFSSIGQMVTFKNEKNLNVVWLTGFSDSAELQTALNKVRTHTGFEKSFIVK